MDKRDCTRFFVSLQGELVSSDIFNEIVITDISERGLCSIIPAANVPAELTPKSKFDIKIHLNSRDAITLSCEERWSYNIDDDFIKKVGWEINNPPAEYSDLLRAF